VSITVMTGADGALRVEALPDGRRRLSLEPSPGYFAPRRTWETSYPESLIETIYSMKGMYACDEIMREEDPRYVEHYLRHEVLGYVEPAEFAGKRVLDFGCGSGASTLVLGRMLPPCEIVGIELEEKLLGIARMRAEFRGVKGVRFLQSPSADSFPAGLGLFDYVIFSAVFEHLLPNERPALLPQIWSHVKPGGILFLNQTPHRWAPIEIHTTGLPLINYLPDGLALRMARLSKRVRPEDDWETLLRAGIRGGTVREILGILAASGSPPILLQPRKSVGDQLDLWYGKLSPRHAWLKQSVWLSLKVLKTVSGVELTPELALALRKAA
jgi:2-polyprenyl-3-methyl-5-hydroxy-6-metoxy-1,4-benzoquinol methylase